MPSLEFLLEVFRAFHGGRGLLVAAALAGCIHLALHDWRRARLLLLAVLGGCLLVPGPHAFSSSAVLTYGYLAIAIGWGAPGCRIACALLVLLAAGLCIAAWALGVSPFGPSLASAAACVLWLAAASRLARIGLDPAPGGAVAAR